MPSEKEARAGIDRLLTAAGWVLQDYKHFNPGFASGIALCEVPLKSGRCDYLLLVNRATPRACMARPLSG
jgi:type I restriction enzyme R subunit